MAGTLIVPVVDEGLGNSAYLVDLGDGAGAGGRCPRDRGGYGRGPRPVKGVGGDNRSRRACVNLLAVWSTPWAAAAAPAALAQNAVGRMAGPLPGRSTAGLVICGGR